MTLTFLFLFNSIAIAQISNRAAYVNPFVGTGGHGHTFPGAVWPFGMLQLSPDTRIDDSWDGCGGYHYDDSFIYGFSHTHLSGTGVSDYGDVLLMPVGGTKGKLPSFNPYAYRSNFDHSTEVAEPGYYSVYLPKPDVKVELTATPRMGVHRYSFYLSKGKDNYTAQVLVDLNHRDQLLSYKLEQINERMVGGWRQSKAWANNQWVYFVIRFSHDIDRIITSSDGKQAVIEFDFDRRPSGGQKIAANMGAAQGDIRVMDLQSPIELEAKVAISFTNEQGAMGNYFGEIQVPHPFIGEYKILKDEDLDLLKIGERSEPHFNDYRNQARLAWNAELSKIAVTSDFEARTFRVDVHAAKTDIEKRKFYTALYHCMIHPSLASDWDGKYRGRDQKIHRSGLYRESAPPFFKVYSVFSIWDTYRALHPLLSIIDPQRTVDFVRTFLLQYKQGGKLPVWELGSCETECMIGYHSVSVIADVILKGIGVEKSADGSLRNPFDYQLALDAMIHSSKLKDSSFIGIGGYRQGYMGIENTAESVSKLLEYAYDDWCIARVAYALKKDDIAKEFFARSERWKNVFDDKSGFMRPRENGGWISPFDPKEVNNHFTEANAWQYSMYVPHDILGLMDKLGGVKATETHLDSLFGSDSRTTGRDQADISGLIGQYAHGNEPSHHMAYLYNYCSKPEKAQAIIDKVCKEFYRDTPDGLIGNEDCGQMSAWYVMSAMGIYAVCPGSNLYTTGVPEFYEVEIAREGKSAFKISRGEVDASSNLLKPMILDGDKDGGANASGGLVGMEGKGPWATHKVELPTEIELGIHNDLKTFLGTAAQKAVLKDNADAFRQQQIEKMRKVYTVPELTVTHDEIMQGDGIIFSQTPAEMREKMLLKTAKQSLATNFVVSPVLEGRRTFKDSMRLRILVPKGSMGVLEIRIKSLEVGDKIKGASGDAANAANAQPIVITVDADPSKPFEWTLKYGAEVAARLVDTKIFGGLPGSNPGNEQGSSEWTTAVYNRKINNFSVQFGAGVAAHPQYLAGGPAALVDEIDGLSEWRAGGWMGFYNQDVSVIIDMGSRRAMNAVGIGFLQDSRAWILMPKEVEVMISNDGVNFKPFQVALFPGVDPKDQNIKSIPLLVSQEKKIKARYVKVIAKNFGKLPEWHQGFPYGGNAYIFMDEIRIK